MLGSRRRRRLLLLVPLLALGGALLRPAPAPAAAPGFFVGADEDAFLWGNSQLDASIARALGLKAVRVTLRWRPGETAVPASDVDALDRVVLDGSGLRLVVSVYGAAADAPRTPQARTQYCGVVGDLLRRVPQVRDVVIWNDPNDQTFWSPQFGAGGTSVAPADYEALLAQCWDAAHAVRADANVVSLMVSKAAAAPGAFTLGYHAPAAWLEKLAAAYRASGRTKPIFDTFGFIPHGASSAERPWTQHADGAMSLGDYAMLMRELAAAFRGTAQPVPGEGSTTIWYLAQGFQTAPDPGKASLYTGVETDAAPVPAWSPQEAADSGAGPGVDQPLQLAEAIELASCQPAVGAYFNFHLIDERDRAGWQSGVLWADGTPKPAYQALRNVIAAVAGRAIDCSSVAGGGAPPRPQPVQPVGTPLELRDLHVASVSTYGARVAWRTSAPADVQVSYGPVAAGVPTAWASVAEDGTASLSGLAAGTTYRVWVRAIGADGQRAQASIDLTTGGIPPRPAVSVDRDRGAILVDGDPFFPLMLYSVCPWQYRAALAAGINLFALNACGTLQAQLDSLGGAAYSAGVAGGRGGSGAGLIGWFHYDEPDGANVSAAALPGGPPGIGGLSFLSLTNHFYSGAAALPWGRGIYPGLIAKADVVGFDLYPLQEWCRPSRLVDDFYAQRELVKLAERKPTFQWIEAAEWKCPGGATAVTPATVRAESWLAIAGGAHGLGFWPGSWPTANARAIAAVAWDVARIGPALYAPDQPVADTSPQVVASARVANGALYVIAVNAGSTATQTTLTVPGLAGRTVSVLDEGRRLASSGDSLTDSFAPLAVHVYVAAPPGP